jgi:hypothetical protein
MGQLAYLGRLPTQTETSIWRDMKVIGNYALVAKLQGMGSRFSTEQRYTYIQYWDITQGGFALAARHVFVQESQRILRRGRLDIPL